MEDHAEEQSHDEPSAHGSRHDPRAAERDVHSVTATGIGGQGIQLLSRTLALAATRGGRFAMLSAEYGGEMRGGPSAASVVVKDHRFTALPVLESSDALIMSHHHFSERAVERLLPGGLCLVNSSVVDPTAVPPQAHVVEVPAARIATELKAPQASGFVLLGAFVELTAMAPADQLAPAMAELLPPYRQAAVPANTEALQAGAEAVRNQRERPAPPTLAYATQEP